MANTVNLTTVKQIFEHTDNTKFIVEENGELNRFAISDLNIDSGGDITIDMESGINSEANPINADTLGGYPANYFASQNNVDEIMNQVNNNINTLVTNQVNEAIDNINLGPKIELNYAIVGGLTEPSSPIENTIWIETDEYITDYIFSKNEPKNPIEGTVWILIGNDSSVAFHSLNINEKKYDEIYPISAKQYVNGAWVDVTAKSYQNGKWIDWWNGQLFVNGNQFNDITGGWKSRKDPQYATHEIGNTLKYHYASDVGDQSAIYTANKIDLTKYKTLFGQCVVTRNANYYQRFGIFNSEPVSTMDWNTYVDVTTGTLSVDISAFTGSFHIGFGCIYYGGVEFTKIWLE